MITFFQTVLARRFLNGKHEIVLKSRLFVLDFSMVFFLECTLADYCSPKS